MYVCTECELLLHVLQACAYYRLITYVLTRLGSNPAPLWAVHLMSSVHAVDPVDGDLCTVQLCRSATRMRLACGVASD